jgi:hypothetical protein
MQADVPVEKVTPPVKVCLPSGTALSVFPPETGSIFYAVTGMGAYGRSLSMPEGAGYEVEVSGFNRPFSELVLCESTEAAFGNRTVSAGVYRELGMKTEYLHIDGQCKYAVMGAGAAQGGWTTHHAC